jgi:hypothetical protein
MRILQVISMGYVCGGAEKSVVLLSDSLRRRGHDVKIMASDRDPDGICNARYINGVFDV